MPADRRLLALPSLRRQAEADAENHHTALLAAMIKISGNASFTLTIHPALVDAQVALLADLTRWQSQAWALRRIAELLGWDLSGDGDSLVFERIPAGWWLAMRVHHTAKGSPLERVFAAPGQTACSWRTAVPGLEGAGRPEAIAAILLHLEGQK